MVYPALGVVVQSHGRDYRLDGWPADPGEEFRVRDGRHGIPIIGTELRLACEGRNLIVVLGGNKDEIDSWEPGLLPGQIRRILVAIYVDGVGSSEDSWRAKLRSYPHRRGSRPTITE